MLLTLVAISPVVDRYPASLCFMVTGGMTLLMTLAWAWVALSKREAPDLNAEAEAQTIQAVQAGSNGLYSDVIAES
ncbi:hypothetical protein ORD21_16955 [Deinococcus sp. ZS9-10]|uniref:MFS transporter n=2 Tax=Deinococcus arenicola TaxID=2994950 RepID=A0ABU4DV44_9DEIO|nr:hypothetical protein [Deinococcus sp. ZS9-10]